uniref:Secreted LY6/PLAUR domain containing 1 n=1 Tax=Canis lupus familiaris TaxID=9615 RepID=A0A8C0N4C6_CANLF
MGRDKEGRGVPTEERGAQWRREGVRGREGRASTSLPPTGNPIPLIRLADRLGGCTGCPLARRQARGERAEVRCEDPTMMGTRLVLLVLLLATWGERGERVVALRCYTCHEPTAVSSCATIATCGTNETMCKTTLYSLETGEAFRCFTCELPTPVSLCKNISVCKPEDTACKTTLLQIESEYPFHQSPMVTRSCSSSCIATDPDSIGAAHLVFCCFHDLCNSVQASRLLGHLP